MLNLSKGCQIHMRVSGAETLKNVRVQALYKRRRTDAILDHRIDRTEPHILRPHRNKGLDSGTQPRLQHTTCQSNLVKSLSIAPFALQKYHLPGTPRPQNQHND